MVLRAHGRPATGRRAWLAGLFVLLLAASARGQGSPSGEGTQVDRVVRAAEPCVVTIVAQRTVEHRDPLTGERQRRQHLRAGTGVAVEESDILTTASVVLGAEHVYVRTVNDLQVEARVVGMDPIFNVALLRVPDLSLPTMRFAAHGVDLGDRVVAMGMSYRMRPTATVGMVAERYREPRTSLLRITNIVYPGNSGGAVLNLQGQLVGLVLGELGAPDLGTSGRDAERRPTGMSFVMPVEDVAPVYDWLRREGRVRHGYLGVSTRAEVVQSDVDGARIPLGAMVQSVQPGGPAARAGLRRGDLIVAFERERVEYPEQLARWVAESRPGSTVALAWVRDGVQRTGRAPLGESPTPLPQWMATGQASPARPAGTEGARPH